MFSCLIASKIWPLCLEEKNGKLVGVGSGLDIKKALLKLKGILL